MRAGSVDHAESEASRTASDVGGSTAPISHNTGKKIPRMPRIQWPFLKVMAATVKMHVT
jgi:hypothetical protein